MRMLSFWGSYQNYQNGAVSCPTLEGGESVLKMWIGWFLREEGASKNRSLPPHIIGSTVQRRRNFPSIIPLYSIGKRLCRKEGFRKARYWIVYHNPPLFSVIIVFIPWPKFSWTPRRLGILKCFCVLKCFFVKKHFSTKINSFVWECSRVLKCFCLKQCLCSEMFLFGETPVFWNVSVMWNACVLKRFRLAKRLCS